MKRYTKVNVIEIRMKQGTQLTKMKPEKER